MWKQSQVIRDGVGGAVEGGPVASSSGSRLMRMRCDAIDGAMRWIDLQVWW